MILGKDHREGRAIRSQVSTIAPRNKLVWTASSLLKDPMRATRLFNEEEYWRDHVSEEYGMERGLPTVDMLDLFGSFQETVDPFSYLEGTCTTMDLALLKLLARRLDSCKYFEIGTWRGESAANVADVAENCVSLDLPESELRRRGRSDAFVNNQAHYSRNLRNVDHLRYDSRKFDWTEYERQFNLVFVDGDHTYEGVRTDTRSAFRLLRDDQSVIVWHDYGLSPETVRWTVLAAILDGCPAELRSSLYHVSNTLCAAFLHDEVQSEFQDFPQTPRRKFVVRIAVAKS